GIMQSGLRVCDLIGALAPGSRPLEGKSFYLDEMKSRTSNILTELIGRLGGKVESFLNKYVSVVVTGNREAVPARPSEWSQAALRKVKAEGDSSPVLQKQIIAQCPGTPRPPVCGSRGKALLEKAIRSQEKSGCSVLSSASSWGVKIVTVDAGVLKADFIKVEDSSRKVFFPISSLCAMISGWPFLAFGSHTALLLSGCCLVGLKRIMWKLLALHSVPQLVINCRKYRPLHMQSLPFPTLSYAGRFSPFETPAPVRPKRDSQPSQDTVSRKSAELVSSGRKPPGLRTHRLSRKKNTGYCECCQTSYQHLDQHLESELHRGFVLDISNYAVVDQLVPGIDAGFVCRPDSPDDALALRILHGSPAPLNPCAEAEEQCRHETARGLQTHSSGHLSSLGTADPTSDVRPVLNPPPQPVEPSSNVPPQAPSEVKCVEEEPKDCLPSLPHPKIPVPDPSPEDSDLSSVPDDVPLSSTVLHLFRVGLDGFSASAVKDLVVVDREPPSPLPSRQPTLDKHEASACSHGPKRRPDNVDHAGHQRGVEPETLPLNVGLTDSDQITGHVSLVDGLFASIPSRLSFPPSSVNPWVRVNPRKRCRSFPENPSPSKKARTCSVRRSDPTNDNSVTHDSEPYCAGLLPVADEGNYPVKRKPETLLQDLLSGYLLAELTGATFSVAAPNDRLPLQQDAHGDCGTWEERVAEPDTTVALGSEPGTTVAATPVPGMSSELGPPELHPFYHDDDLRQQLPPCCDPPTLLPSVSLPPPPECAAQASASRALATSLLSPSFSFCLESALIPSFASSSSSSESDWDSGLLARLAPAVCLPPGGAHCEPDLGERLQRSCAGAQDGSYALRLRSVLQPAIPSAAGFGERMNLTALYGTIEAADMRVIQGLGV
ncbi:hypothetical protein P4O66_011315, partial [Electrophorus voltai]